ncbi:antitoxin [Saccharopolyspora hordei]|uniref:Antitoxin n=1 Tax=Saccharopolyspora hordei TaxID=1838 RepID=A0A853AP11_9PSEU|nr:antitoxin [Saccharopolyspora hordei]NYI81847.1 hypothetical protein [Saccharopolyspora hordei]
MGLGDFKDRVQDLGREHSDQVDKGVDAAASGAKEKFGHDEQVDQAAQKGKEFVGDDSEQEPGQ